MVSPHLNEKSVCAVMVAATSASGKLASHSNNSNNNNNNNIYFTAIGLSPGGSSYFTCTQI